MTPKERNLLKGAIRRVFSRSDIRRYIINKTLLPNHTDTTRPRVKNWCKCELCHLPTPKSYMQVDHIQPVIPIGVNLENITWDELVDRIWCDTKNLQGLCEACHDIKTERERKERKDERKRTQGPKGSNKTNRKRVAA